MCVLWAAYTFNNRTCVQHFSIYVSPHQCGKSLVYICLHSALFLLFFFSFDLLCFFSVGFLLLVCVCTPDKEFHLGGEGDVKKKRVHTDFLLLLLLPRSYWVHIERRKRRSIDSVVKFQFRCSLLLCMSVCVYIYIGKSRARGEKSRVSPFPHPLPIGGKKGSGTSRRPSGHAVAVVFKTRRQTRHEPIRIRI